MRDFACPNCGQRLAFENSVCLSCGSPIGFDLAARDFAVLGPQGVTLLAPARQGPIGTDRGVSRITPRAIADPQAIAGVSDPGSACHPYRHPGDHAGNEASCAAAIRDSGRCHQ